MSDRIVTAPISKIVEAIMKVSYPNGRPDFTYWDGRRYDERKELLTEALQSMPTQDERRFPTRADWCNACKCDPSERHGETWCCNNCGAPTSNHTQDEHEVLKAELIKFMLRDTSDELKADKVYIDSVNYIIDTYLAQRGGGE